MNFDKFLQINNNKGIFVDVIFYVATSLLISIIFCYIFFISKNYFQEKKIDEFGRSLMEIGTSEQKQKENQVFSYQKKINDFSKLIKEHKLSSKALSFVEDIAIKNVWFTKFNFSQKQGQISLNGDTDDIVSLSRQMHIFETAQNVQKAESFNTDFAKDGKVNFSINIFLNPKVFDPIEIKTPAENNIQK